MSSPGPSGTAGRPSTRERGAAPRLRAALSHPTAWVAALSLAACGYTVGHDLEDQGLRTVAVEVVGNATFRQRIEAPLTARIHEALPVHTGLVPASPRGADAVLQVEIVEVRGRSLVQGGSQPVLEGALELTVRAVLIDRRSGAVLRDRRITDRAEFRSPIGEDEASAYREGFADLARKIALALEPDF